MSKKQQEEIDPSIYQYDQVYDQIKGNNQKEKNKERSRSRSREKEKKKQAQQRPRQSKYIGKMKRIVEDRQKDLEFARQKVIRKENQRMGVNDEMVFVTQSYLKKKQQEKEAARKKAEEQQKNAKMNVEKGNYVEFKRQMLDQRLHFGKK